MNNLLACRYCIGKYWQVNNSSHEVAADPKYYKIKAEFIDRMDMQIKYNQI